MSNEIMLTVGVSPGIVEGVKSHPLNRGRTPDHYSELATAWLAGLRSERTRSAYAGDLNRFASWLGERGAGSPLEAGSHELDRYRDACESEGVAPATMARRMSALRSFYAFAASAGEITTSPAVQWFNPLPAPSRTGSLDASEVGALLSAAGELGSRTAVLIGLMLFDGLRLEEVLSADVNDVVARRGKTAISVERRDGAHVFAIDRWTSASLRRYLGGRREGPLLLGESPTRDTARLTRFGANYLIKRAGTEAGLDRPLSANALRRSFVSRSHADGTPIEAIRARLGHRDVRTTLRHLTPRQIGS